MKVLLILLITKIEKAAWEVNEDFTKKGRPVIRT